MIRAVVDFALNKRLLVLAGALLLFGWGIVSFHRLPVEAYPDVADNYVEIITQWPGISAEQMEQQVTIPLENAMNGVPGIVHLRSFSLFGLSDLKLIFADETEDCLEPGKGSRATLAGHSAAGSRAPDGHGLEPGRANLFLHAL